MFDGGEFEHVVLFVMVVCNVQCLVLSFSILVSRSRAVKYKNTLKKMNAFSLIYLIIFIFDTVFDHFLQIGILQSCCHPLFVVDLLVNYIDINQNR